MPEYKKRVSAHRRKLVMERDEYQCVFCWAEDDLTLDHIIPISRGGTNALDNLQVLCRRCNQWKGSRLLESASKPEHTFD